MSSGVRGDLKSVIPKALWPIFRFIDVFLINFFYVFLAGSKYYVNRSQKRHVFLHQHIRKWRTALRLGGPDGSKLEENLTSTGISCLSGRHSVFIGEPDDIERISPGLTCRYPHPVALKLIKSQEISGDGTPYYTSNRLAPASTWFSMYAVGTMLEKATVSNLLNVAGVAPRVYDLVILESGCGEWIVAFVGEAVLGGVVTGDEGICFIEKFKKVLTKLGMATISIKEHCDLRPPEFRHNIQRDDSGTYYVDIQNFVLKSSQVGRDLLKRADQQRRWPQEGANGDEDTAPEGALFQNLVDFLTPSGIAIETASCLDWKLPGEQITISWLHAGGRWAYIVRPDEVSELVTDYLYYHGFSRFDILPLVTATLPEDTIIFVTVQNFSALVKTLGPCQVVLICVFGAPSEMVSSLSVEAEQAWGHLVVANKGVVAVTKDLRLPAVLFRRMGA